MTTFNISKSNSVVPRQNVGIRINVVTWSMILVVTSMIYHLPGIPFIPITVSLWIWVPLFILCSPIINRRLPLFFKLKPFLIFVIILFVVFCVRILTSGINYSAIAKNTSIITTIITVIILATYASSSHKRMWLFAHTITLLLYGSMIWFLLEASVREPFFSIRNTLYYEIYDHFEKETGLYRGYQATGLTPLAHYLGYQIATFLPLCITMFLSSKRLIWKLFYITGIGVGLLALYFSSQRSALLALVLGIIAIIVFNKKVQHYLFSWKILKDILLVIVIVSLSVYIINQLEWTGSLQTPLVEKMHQEKYKDDARFRLQLQQRAFELTLTNPFGLEIAGKDWEKELYWYTYHRFDGDVFYPEPIASHNGYLQIGLNYGLIMFLLACFWLVLIFLSAIHLIKNSCRYKINRLCILQTGLGATMLGLYFPQAMLHNTTIFTLDPPSLLVFTLFLASYLRSKQVAS